MADQYQFKQNPLQPPRLTKPVQAFDTGSTVAQNMAGQGTPSASNIFAAMRTATAQRQMQQPQQAVTAPTPQPQPQQTPTPPAITSMDELAAAIGYTSPQEEERQRKASVANRRIMAVADALRHIGNIANTVNYAPAQQFNSPVAEEQARYERGKAMRDKANQTYLAYQQAKAAQDAKQRQWEQQFQLNIANAASQDAYRREQARIAGERAADQRAYQEGNLARQKQADADRKAYNEARLKQDKWYKGGMLSAANRRVRDQERRTTAYVSKVNGGGGNNKQFVVDTAMGTLYAPGEKTKLDAHMKQLYNQAEKINDALAKKNGWTRGIDGSYRDASGNRVNDSRLINIGNLKGILGSEKRDYDAAFMAVANNSELAKYAKDNLHWSKQGNSGGAPSIGWDDEDEDDGDNEKVIGW